MSPFKATSKGSASDFCPYMGSESPLAAVRPQAQKAACGDNTSSLGGDEALSIQIEPIAWYPGYSPLGEQSRHKHGNRPNLAVQLLGVSPLWGSLPTPPKILMPLTPLTAAKLPLGRSGRPCGRALDPALYALRGPEHWQPALSKTLRGAALRHAPLEQATPFTYNTAYLHAASNQGKSLGTLASHTGSWDGRRASACQGSSAELGPRNPASCLAARLAIPLVGLQNLQDFSATLGPGILQILPAARSLSHLHLLGSRLQSTHKRQGCWKTLHAFFLLDKSGYRWIQMQREP